MPEDATPENNGPNDSGEVKGLRGYDTSYSGGSRAMPDKAREGDADPVVPDTPTGYMNDDPEDAGAGMNTNLDPALANTRQDEKAMQNVVDEHKDQGDG